MRKYIKILSIVLKNAYIRDSKIIGAVTSNFLVSLVEIVITISMFSAIFNNVHTVAGWNYYQVIFLYTLMKSIVLVNGLVARSGLNHMASEYVRVGDYDFYLMKPVNTILLVSMSKPRVYNLLTLIVTIILGIYAAAKSGYTIHPVNVLWFLLSFFLACLLFYFINIITITPVFWFVRLYSLRDVMNRISQFMRYPAGIYSLIMRAIFYTLLPVLAVTYLPAWMLFNFAKSEYIIYMFVITIAFGLIAVRLWKFGEQHYGSASS